MQNAQSPPYGLRMPPDLRTQVREMARNQDRSMNSLIVHLLRRAIGPSGSDETAPGQQA
jgi:predicted HicB family RNase H-like nuclease